MSIAKDHYLDRMAQQGHHTSALAETALALVELYQRADLQNRRDIGRNLTNEFYRVLTQVHGWAGHDARFAAQEIAKAFQEVKS